MRILLTNVTLSGRTGTEIVIRDLALAYRERGHEPIVFSKELGPIAVALRDKGVRVTSSLRWMVRRPDIIHGHHNVSTIAAMCRFPDAPVVWVGHDTRNWFDAPPLLSRIHRYAAADDKRAEFIATALGIDRNLVEFRQNAVDLRRIPPRIRPLPDRPERLLAFTKVTGWYEALARFCRQTGLQCSGLGRGVGRIVADPERELIEADVVIATERSALEALCAGAAVIVADGNGVGGLVTPSNYEAMRRKLLSPDTFREPFSVEAIARELSGFRREDCLAVSEQARRDCDLHVAVDRWLDLYGQAIAAGHTAWTAADLRWLDRFEHDWPARRKWANEAWASERHAVRRFLNRRKTD